MKNPLLEDFKNPYGTAPFSSIKNEHFKPAFEEAIQIAKSEIDLIVTNKSVPTFENTLEALEFSGQQLSRISSIFFNLNSAETSDEIQKIAQEVSPLLSEFSNDITLNEDLFKKIKFVFNSKETLNLSSEQEMLLTNNYKSFVRNGANLTSKEKEELRKIDTQLSKLKLMKLQNLTSLN